MTERDETAAGGADPRQGQPEVGAPCPAARSAQVAPGRKPLGFAPWAALVTALLMLAGAAARPRTHRVVGVLLGLGALAAASTTVWALVTCLAYREDLRQWNDEASSFSTNATLTPWTWVGLAMTVALLAVVAAHRRQRVTYPGGHA